MKPYKLTNLVGLVTPRINQITVCAVDIMANPTCKDSAQTSLYQEDLSVQTLQLDEMSPPAKVERMTTSEISFEEVKDAPSVELMPVDTDVAGQASSTPPFTLYGLYQFMGSGFMMSVAFLDPGNLEAGTESLASAGYLPPH
jgi:hypothetical protein